ncbi:MAG TPA: substrate-binding domain-containing protein [Trueperaceae bacterium]|nr:substrate-binding domain-containing protein [Trueperaceae bacterium]
MRTSVRPALRAFRLVVVAILVSGAAWAQDASSISVSSFTSDFSAMKLLTDLASKGTGKIGVLLPETTTSARYTAFDAPFLKQAFQAAGVPDSDVILTNAQGSEATQLTQAQAAITQGATVLLVDPISSGVGASIEKYAADNGVAVIDYDRLTLGGSRAYYVSFDNVQVGKLIGDGFVACVTDWKVANPHVLIMNGAPTDNNATLFSQGYHSVLDPLIKAGTYTLVGEPAGTWDPAQARTTFEGQYTAHNDINAVVTPNDDNANAVIAYLKTLNVPANTFPTTGQDATLQGLQNILAGYQCGTVYKPINLEAQAAAALAIFLRAGEVPPSGLVNSTTPDTESKMDVPSVLLTPIWVTTKNMADTVVKDGFTKAADLCAGFTDQCKASGIGQ